MASSGAIRAGRAAVEMSLDDKEFEAGMDAAAKRLRAFGYDVTKIGEETAKGFGGWIKKQQKEKRDSGETATKRALGGGLANLGLDALGAGVGALVLESVGKSLETATEKAAQFADEMREGKRTAGEVADELAKTIPIAGSFYAAGRNIHEMLTGERHEIQLINEEAERTLKIGEAQLRASDLHLHALRDIRNETAKLTIENAAIGKDSYAQEVAAIAKKKIDLAEQLKKQEEEAKKANAQNPEQVELAKGLEAASNAAAAAREIRDALRTKQEAGGYVSQDEIDFSNKSVSDAEDDVRLAQRRITGARDKKESNNAETAAANAKKNKAAAEQIAAEEADLARRQEQATQEIYRNGSLALLKIRAEAQAQQLRNADKAYEAEIVSIRAALAEQKSTIQKAAEDQAKGIGATNALDPRRLAIMQTAADAQAAAEQGAQAKIVAAQQQAYEKKRGLELDLQELKDQGLQNEHDRELALIADRYAAEIDIAKQAGHGDEAAQLAAKRDQEIANKKQDFANQTADAQRDLDDQIAENKARLTNGHGIAADIAIDKLKEAAEIARELDPRTTKGVGIDRIKKAHELSQELLLRGAGQTLSSTDSRQVSAFGSHLSAFKDIAKNTQETKEALEKIHHDGMTIQQ